MARIRVKNITKYFDEQKILDNVSLDIKDGEIFGIVGPSGCGKTTLLRIIAGLDMNFSGQVFYDNNNVTKLPPSDRNISMVFQNYALYPHIDVKRNIAFPLNIKKYAKDIVDSEVKQTTEILDADIERYLSFLPKELSEGHKQTTAVGRSIIKKKINVLLMDEPLSNLDAKVRIQSRYKIKRLIQSLSNTVIYVTANGLETMALCDRIAVLLDKKFVQIGTPEILYSDTENLFICQLFSKFPINQIDGIIEESYFRKNNHVIKIANKVRHPIETIMAIRQEDISLSQKNKNILNDKVLIEGKLVEKRITPPHINLKVNTNFGEILVATMDKEAKKLKLGNKIKLYIDTDKIFFFDRENEVRIRI